MSRDQGASPYAALKPAPVAPSLEESDRAKIGSRDRQSCSPSARSGNILRESQSALISLYVLNIRVFNYTKIVTDSTDQRLGKSSLDQTSTLVERKRVRVYLSLREGEKFRPRE
jgi:hypothetical protein